MKQHSKILRNDDIPIDDWNKLLKRVDHPSYFQSYKGFKQLSKFHGWKVEAIGWICNGELLAVLVYVIQKEKGITSFFSERCIIFSGPLFADEVSLKEVLNYLEKVVSGSVYMEVRNGCPTLPFAHIYQELGWSYVSWLNFIVDTSDQDVMLKRISESRRRQLKKAEKMGVVNASPKQESEVLEFYQILVHLYQTKIKKPLPEYEMFRTYFLEDPKNFVLVFLDQKVIGGILCPFLDDIGMYEFYIAGLDQDFKDGHPSAMATFGAMKQANEMGIPIFDFMGGGSPDESYGVREFKARFGGEQVEWGRWLKVRKNTIYQLGKWYIQWRSK